MNATDPQALVVGALVIGVLEVLRWAAESAEHSGVRFTANWILGTLPFVTAAAIFYAELRVLPTLEKQLGVQGVIELLLVLQLPLTAAIFVRLWLAPRRVEQHHHATVIQQDPRDRSPWR